MQSFRSSLSHSRLSLATLLVAAAAVSSAFASDASDRNTERETLAALTRQIDLASRLADRAAASSGEPARYHFDYARLQEDLQRVRAGVRDYLSPQRAQPRDPAPLSGAYTRESSSESQGRLP